MKHTILISGASRGLGYATAKALSGPDTHIIAVARTVGGLEELDDAIVQNGGSSTLVPLDITDEIGLQALGASIHERWGRLDGFIHCAAHATPLSPVGHISPKDLDRAWAVNARATQRLITMLDPLLKASDNGHAVYVDDPGMEPKFAGAYRTSKRAARSFVESWQAECAQTGPKVLIFEPSAMPTALRARFYPGENRDGLTSPDSQGARLAELYRNA